MNFAQPVNGAVQIGIRAANLCDKERHAMLIQLYAGKTVPTFSPMQRSDRGVGADPDRVAIEQARDFGIGHPDLGHAIIATSFVGMLAGSGKRAVPLLTASARLVWPKRWQSGFPQVAGASSHGTNRSGKGTAIAGRRRSSRPFGQEIRSQAGVPVCIAFSHPMSPRLVVLAVEFQPALLSRGR